MAIENYYKLVKPQLDHIGMTDSQDISGNSVGSYSWYHTLVQGSATRITRYKEYDVMDNDIDIARALDILAQEIAGNAPKSDNPLLIQITADNEENIKSSTVVTLNAALKTWCNIQDWANRLYPTIRNTIKYGDQFFIRPKKSYQKLIHVGIKNVDGAIVPINDVSKIAGWFIKSDYKRFNMLSSGAMQSTGISYGTTIDPNDKSLDVFDNEEIVRFSLNSDMTDEAPFGESVLRCVYKTFKQKELLEDALLIYRIQRAPEKRVFRIDVGGMHASKVAHYLEQVKNDFRQKKAPTDYYGKSSVESIYNPQSMHEDFFVARRPDGTGTEIDVLPAGQNLGQLEDLDYFYNKIWRGLRVPKSFMDSVDGGTFNDGTVGIAYQQEIVFSLYIEQIQKQLETTFDREFKKFLESQKLNIDNTIFKVVLPEPSNFAKSRLQAINGNLLQNYGNISDSKYISPRFAQEKYLMLTKEEVHRNQRYKLEEMGINPDTATKKDLIRIYNPDAAEMGGQDGGMGGDPGLNGPIDDSELEIDDELDADSTDEQNDADIDKAAEPNTQDKKNNK